MMGQIPRASVLGVMTFLIIAHRGYSSEAPENTLAAFDLAVATGFRHIELDVQLTSDGVPIVIHDTTLDRTTDGSGPVTEATSAYIRGLDAGFWFSAQSYRGVGVPTLEDVLIRYSAEVHLHIELKSTQPELPEKVSALLERYGWRYGWADEPGAVPGVTLSSFHIRQLRRSRSLMPGVRHGWLVRQIRPMAISGARRLGLTGIYPNVNTLTSEGVELARSAGLLIRVWGIGSVAHLAHALELEADGATVDWPQTAMNLLLGV